MTTLSGVVPPPERDVRDSGFWSVRTGVTEGAIPPQAMRLYIELARELAWRLRVTALVGERLTSD